MTVIPGELLLHVKTVFRHTCVPVGFEEMWINSTFCEEVIHHAITTVHQNRVTLKGNTETEHDLPPSHKSHNSNVSHRSRSPCQCHHFKSLPGMEIQYRSIDILVV